MYPQLESHRRIVHLDVDTILQTLRKVPLFPPSVLLLQFLLVTLHYLTSVPLLAHSEPS